MQRPLLSILGGERGCGSECVRADAAQEMMRDLPEAHPGCVGAEQHRASAIMRLERNRHLMRGGVSNGVARGDRLMTREEQTALVERAQQGDRVARDRLIEGSMRLVVSIAHRLNGRGVALEDLISEGTLGLIHAIDRFDGARGVRFTTFAARNIQHSMQRAIGESLGVVRLPPKMRRLLARWARESHRFRVQNGRPADPRVLAQLMGMPGHALARLERARVVQMGSNGDGAGVDGASQGDGRRGEWEGEAIARVRSALERLEASQAAVVRLHFGLSGARQMPLKDVARVMGMSVSRARHELAAALGELRRAMVERAGRDGGI